MRRSRYVSGALCLAVLLAAFLAFQRKEPPPSHVLLIVYDTLRADHLGAYGYDRPVSPNIDRLAARGAVFESVVSLSSWTKPSVATLLSSINPNDHQVGYFDSRLPAGTVTLPRVLHDAGFETFGFSANTQIRQKTGFAQGFDRFQRIGNERAQDTSTSEIFRRALECLNPTRRQFIYLHLMGPHGPYIPSPAARRAIVSSSHPEVDERQLQKDPRAWYRFDSPEELQHLQSLYDAEILDEDRHLAMLFDGLAERGLDRRSLVVFTADHGEAFHEHGKMEHGNFLFQEEIHVPLIFRGPNVHPVRRTDIVGLHDVAPTILGMVRLKPPPSFQGADVFNSHLFHRVIRLREFAEREGESEWYGVIAEGAKAIWNAQGTTRLFFEDWRLDAIHLDRASQMEGAFERLLALGRHDEREKLRTEKIELDDESIQALKNLGYL